MPERLYPKFERVFHKSPILTDGALTWYGLGYIAAHQYNPFYWLARPRLSDEVVVGQEEKVKALAEHIVTSPPGSVATIIGPFGSGKTDFIFGLANELIARGNMRPEEIHRITINDRDWDNAYSMRDILDNNSSFASGHVDIESVPPRLIIIEENERAEKEIHENGFIIAGLLLPKIPFLILTGESTLKDPLFFELLGVDQSKVYQVEMDPVTPDSLNQAMKKRLTFLFGDQVKDFNPDSLFDPEFLDFFIPNTNPPIATYREVLGEVSRFGKYVKEMRMFSRTDGDSPALIDGNLYRDIEASNSSGRKFSNEPHVQTVVSRIHELIRNTYDPKVPFQPIPYAQLIAMGLYDNLNVEQIEREEGRMRRLNSLLRSGDIIEINKSMLTEKSNHERIFLPTMKGFLDARYNPLIT